MRTWSTSPPRHRARALATLGTSLVLVGLLARPAMAGTYVNQAASGLRRGPVYVDGAVRRAMPPASAKAVLDRVRRADTPVYVAVLPAAALKEAGNDPNRLAEAIAGALARAGTVAVAAGSTTGAGSNTLDPGVASAAMRAARGAHRGSLSATMTDFVDRVDRAAAAEEPFWRSVWDRPLVRPIAIVLGILILFTAVDVAFLNVLRRRRRGRGTGFADVQALAREDIVALGEDLRNLDVGLEAESESSHALRDYGRAYESFQHGVEAFERAGAPEDFAPVSTALEAGRFYMSVARARFEGREPPQRRPPCFFDTRHGPSVDDVGWMPQSGPPRPVPACDTCMHSVASGIEPAARRVVADGRRMPFYEAPAHFESWFAGYFGGAAASLVDGFPLGRALDDGYAGGLNTFGGGYGYLPVSYADTGVLDAGGADIGQRRPGADTELLIRPAGHDAGSGEE
ncbi:MAG TPA: hypothetical protein VFA46_08075 [Actinomycetes bacterium]|jgi:hypothetical protein|nr:hypothetical protein [Actinomycetes bacterium]